MKGIQIGKEEVKLLLSANDIIYRKQTLKTPPSNSVIINKHSQSIGYKNKTKK